jgi:putative methyltransferase (TIGR04325 family)
MNNKQWRDCIKLFLPPILVKLVRSIKYSLYKPELSYAPAGWDTALKKSDDIGWNSAQAVAIEKQRWESYCKALSGTGPIAFMHEHDNPTELRDGYHHRNITFAYVLALAALKKGRVSILDYGGSLGHNYYFAKAVLPDYIKIDFHCKEVPLMVKAGEQLNKQITWYSDDSCLDRKYDLVIINGVLQYIKDWRHFLSRLVTCVEGHFFLGHLPLVNVAQGFVVLQRRYGTEMLYYQFNRNELLTLIDLCLVREFLTGIQLNIKNAPGQCELRSFLYRKD